MSDDKVGDDEKAGDAGEVIHLVINNEISTEKLNEEEKKDLIMDWYTTSRGLLIAIISDEFNLDQALIKLKEGALWGLGVLDVIDKVVDNNGEDEDE